MCDARLFDPQIKALPVSSTVADLTRHDSVVDMARAVLQDAPPAFAIAGLSMGGIVAFEIWRQAPDRVSHLALIDTNPHADTFDKRSMRLAQIEMVMNGKLRELAIDSLKPAYLARSNRDDEKILGTILDMTLDLGPDVFARQSMALKERPDSVPTLPTISCPTAVICGKEDKLCPVDYHELMADEIPGASLTVADDCGHLATLERPDIVNRELERLLNI